MAAKKQAFALTWSSIKGSYFSGIVISHLVKADRSATLCGKAKGLRLFAKGYRFDPKRDCKVCAKIAEQHKLIL